MDYRKHIASIISKKVDLEITEFQIKVPPNKTQGDYSFPCFFLAKKLGKDPTQIATEIFSNFEDDTFEKIEIVGSYVNFFLDRTFVAKASLIEVFEKKQTYGKSNQNKKIVIESPGPNTNKPLHLGHVRNMVIGNALENIYKFLGNDVVRVDIVNDRGIHICKSMLAYQMFGNDAVPGKKTDHFVGDYYVLYDKKSKENPEMEEQIKTMLRKWEEGDHETMKIWKKMNDFAIKGMLETYKRYGTKIDKAYYESDHYKKGKEIVEENLNKIFKKDEKGNIFFSSNNVEKKILLRADGTSVYITQDISLGKIRYNDYEMDEMIYVVGSEQIDHFKTLFEIFEKLDYPFKKGCYHLAYGMVYLPDGKMKSREGNVVDADTLADEVKQTAFEKIKERHAIDNEKASERAERIGISAIKFFMLKYDSKKDFVYEKNKSLSFQGETGPYIQYTYARTWNIIKKYGTKVSKQVDFSLLKEEDEKDLILKLADFQNTIMKAGEEYKPSLITRYLIDLSQMLNTYYHKHTILHKNSELKKSRILLIYSLMLVLEIGMKLLGVDVLENM